MSASPRPAHQKVVAQRVTLLNVFVRVHRLGWVMVEPDVRFSLVGVVSPDLIVEVLSPGTEIQDRGRKLDHYRRHRVPEDGIVDPAERTLEVHGSIPVRRHHLFQEGGVVRPCVLS